MLPSIIIIRLWIAYEHDGLGIEFDIPYREMMQVDV